MATASRLTGRFQQMALWPRLVLAVTAGFLLLFGIFGWLSLQAVNDSTARVLAERLVITQMAARDLDAFLTRAFYELEKATEFAAFDPRAPSQAEEVHILAHTYGRVGTFALGVYYLAPDGKVVLAEPPSRAQSGKDLAPEEHSRHVRKIQEAGRRGVSDPFVDPYSGKPTVALTVPVLARDGRLVSVLSGLIDVSGAEVAGPLRYARDLGHTGHAELVDHRGLVIAGTDYASFLRPGEHMDFYMRMLSSGSVAVENTRYVPWHPVPEGRQDERHIMAFVSLAEAPWGVSVGGVDWETLAPVTRLRNAMLVGGAATLVALWLLALLGARLLVRPVKLLTTAAQRMAAGDLQPAISVSEGGEIGLLADSLEMMRAQLRESMDRMRRWGEELETKVNERTQELATRNRQLAAVTAVATAANEVRDVESMLDRCLQVILRHTGMDTGALRLLDPERNQLVIAAARGDFSGFPCRQQAVALGACPCGRVASVAAPLFLGPEERQNLQPPCSAPGARGLAILPLVSPKGVLGVLSLSRLGGGPPEAEDGETLAAICSQLAVALENAQLLRELAQLQAQHELDRLKTEFISAVSHELRTPLGIIKGYASALSLEDVAIDPSIRREFLQVVEEEADKLQQMIEELLDTSRLQAGRLQVDPRPVSLKELLDVALHRAAPVVQQGGHVLKTPQLPEKVMVNADPGRVEQVLYNLLDNAVRYSSPGTPIEIGVDLAGDEISISVTDHGEGIPSPDLEHIFEPFYRGATAQRGSTRGVGLGLAICQGIVKAHGGRLWVDSVLTKGSTFIFTLPVIAQPISAA
ncbi:MAG: GAF domain-containing protein [Chloroflexi bacterium]|nr:GAF domain-containing protein [Chloroflexota bacterium]